MILSGYKVPGFGLRVRASMDIRTGDISGETSGTDEVDKGTKGKSLTVSLSIPFTKPADLRQLIRVSEAKDDGERRIYTITDTTANLGGVRQVRFAERVGWEEKDGLRAWDVSFTLREYLSNPEREEQRDPKPKAAAQVNDGTKAVPSNAQTAQATFKKVVKGVGTILK